MTTATETMVCFRTRRGLFALPVAATLAVRPRLGLVDLPGPRADVVGVLPGDPPLTVSNALGDGGGHVLVVVADDERFGLDVLEVVGLRRCPTDVVGPPPKGQQGRLVVGTFDLGDELALVVDAGALAGLL